MVKLFSTVRAGRMHVVDRIYIISDAVYYFLSYLLLFSFLKAFLSLLEFHILTDQEKANM